MFVQGFDQLGARVYRVFEIGRETDGPRRAGVDAQMAEHARPQVVLVKHQAAFRLARLGIGDHLGGDTDGFVGTCRLAEAAGDALVLPPGIVGHGQLAAETVEHLERGPVLGVLLGDLLGEELPPGHLHTRQQGSQPVEKSFDIATHD